MDHPDFPGDHPDQGTPTPNPPTPSHDVDHTKPTDPPGDAAQGADEKAIEIGHTGVGGAFGG